MTSNTNHLCFGPTTENGLLTYNETGDANTMYLVLPAGSLTAGGHYAFQLTAHYAQGTDSASAAPGYSVLAVQINAPPSSGTIDVTVRGGEPIGVVLQDPYDLACSGWVDDITDMPLLYSFYYAIMGAATEYQLVSNTPTTSYDGALLPRGGGNASEIICIAYVADAYAAASRTTAVATVLPMSVSVSDLANLTARLLADAFDAGNVEARAVVWAHDLTRGMLTLSTLKMGYSTRDDEVLRMFISVKHHSPSCLSSFGEGVFQGMVASSSVLNAPNCSVPCSSGLDRAPCEVSGMCGSCTDGFVGVPGPSNEPCYVAGEHCANGVLDGTETDIDCGGACAPCEQAGATCTFDADCLYSWCTTRGLCAVPVKPCPGSNCTFGRGVCSHVDVTGAVLAARDCLVNDWACSAVCTCGERVDANGSAVGMWYGDDCSLDEVGFAGVQALRKTLLASLGSATLMQDITTEALNQQASSLSSLVAVPWQLAGGSVFDALGLVGGIAARSEGAGLSDGTSDTVGGTISSLLSSGLVNSNTTTKHSPAVFPTTAVTGTSAGTTDNPTSAPSEAQLQMRRGRRVLFDRGSTTFAPTTALADGAALIAVVDAIHSLSAAQLKEAVAGEVNERSSRRTRRVRVQMGQKDTFVNH